MKPSQRALLFVQGFEKLRLTAYLPTPNDRPTIGWGQTGPDIKLGMTWTREQADAAFETTVAGLTTWLNKQLYGIPTTQGQLDALFSLAYNIGRANLAGSTLLRMHKLGRYDAAAAEFPKWSHQAGKVLAGLLKRRLAEQALYRS